MTNSTFRKMLLNPSVVSPSLLSGSSGGSSAEAHPALLGGLFLGLPEVSSPDSWQGGIWKSTQTRCPAPPQVELSSGSSQMSLSHIYNWVPPGNCCTLTRYLSNLTSICINTEGLNRTSKYGSLGSNSSVATAPSR